jgi:hypothetical protein
MQSASLFNARNYTIDEVEVEPKVLFQCSQRMNIGFKWSFNQKDGQDSDLRQLLASTSKLSFEFNRNVSKSSSLKAVATYINQQFSGNTLSPAAFEMLQGFAPGANYQWTINLNSLLGAAFQINLMYEGRSIPNSGTAHTGKVSAKLMF